MARVGRDVFGKTRLSLSLSLPAICQVGIIRRLGGSIDGPDVCDWSVFIEYPPSNNPRHSMGLP